MKSDIKKTSTTSVIIPAYNEQEYLGRCLEALLDQSLPIDQIIVVDNNSTDGSIEAAQKKYSTVTFIAEVDQGIAQARNAGFEAATGEIIIKIDADTITRKDWHEGLVADMDGSGAAAWSGYFGCKEVNKYSIRISEFVGNSLVFGGMRLVSGLNPLFGCNMAMHRAAWEDIRLELSLRDDIWEDLDMTIGLSAFGHKVFVSKAKRVDISSRSINASARKIYWRLSGQARTYWMRRRYLSFAASLVLLQVSFAFYLVGLPLVRIGRKLSTRPRPEQC